MATIITRAGKGTPLTHPEVDANFTNLNTDKLESGSTAASLTITSVDINGGTVDGAVIGGAVPAAGSFTNITVTGTVDGRDVAADGTKLDGIEAGATADQTAGEIKTLYESNLDTNAFTDAEQTKLAGIEALADVTDTANVTAAGALMDSELTNEAAVKALNQGVATTDGPSFVTATLTGTTAVTVPVGTTAQRPTPATGQFRFNSDEGKFEGYDGSAWGNIGGGGGFFRGENGAVGDPTTGPGDIFRINEQELNTSTSIGATENASCTGPLAIASGVTLTVTSGGSLVIL